MSARALVLFAALFTLCAACGQTSGEVCQLDGDCESGLVCCKDLGVVVATTAARGVCRTPQACSDFQMADAGAPVADSGIDSSLPDAGRSMPGDRCVTIPDAGPPFCFSGLECFGEAICIVPGMPPDAGADSGSDAGTDAGSDAAEDAGPSPPDADQDAGLDGGR